MAASGPFPAPQRAVLTHTLVFVPPRLGNYDIMSRGFRHEALFYLDVQGFLDGTLPFVEAGLDRGEPVMVAVDERKTERLRDALGARADEVEFVDMAPARSQPGPDHPRLAGSSSPSKRLAACRSRGIGEPAWPGRSA